MTSHPDKAPSTEASRTAFYDRIADDSLVALWTRLEALAPPEPVVTARPHLWPYERVRPALLESGSLISAQEAERRVLVLENPGLPGSSRITPMLYGGLQLILPGEVAPSHRHTISALRFIVEGSGAYTAVDGEPTQMHPGDFVITPAWSWHAHGHEGDGPDLGIVTSFNAVFFERHPHEHGPQAQPAGASGARYGSGLLPLQTDRSALNSPVFNYPYARTREALAALARSQAADPHFGHLLRYANPLNGGWAMATMATTMRLLPAGFETRPYRATEGIVFSVVEGRGSLEVGGQRIPFGPKDTFVVPGWLDYVLRADEEAVLFSYSDRAAQEKLGIFRERKG
jgi:gentisate 1,2-dioxygenase